MKEVKFIFCLAFLVFSAGITTTVYGQRKQISGNEFYALSSAAQQKKYDLSRRVETVSETFTDGNLTKTQTRIEEILLPDKSRYVFREKIGDKVNETEIITIENFQYSRENDGKWTKIDLSKLTGGTGSGIGSRSVNCRQITSEATFLNGYSAQLLEDLAVNSSSKGLTFREEKYWISDDGLLLKSEESEGLFSPRVENSRTVAIYEYNPNIKIEAPIK